MIFRKINQFLIYFLSLGSTCLIAHEEGQYVRFEPFLNSPFEQAIRSAGAQPVFIDYSKNTFQETFADFIKKDELVEISNLLESWSPAFFSSEMAFPWQGSNYRFGVFGGKQSTHKKTRWIQGMNCKMCIEYCDWILENHADKVQQMPHLSRLIQQLVDLDQICHRVFLAKVAEIAVSHPEILQIFYLYKGRPRLPITLRLIRFEDSDSFTLPLHFDISLLSLIFPSDDHPLDECLLVAPADSTPFTIEKLKRALRPIPSELDQSCALLISGTLFNHLNIPIPPTPHGVIPHNRGSRCVIVACLHIPNLDTSEQSTSLPELKEVPVHLR